MREMLYEAVFWRPNPNKPSLKEGLADPGVRNALVDWGEREGDAAVITYTTRILKDDHTNGTGIPVPDEVVAALQGGKRAPVIVTLKGYTYRSTLAVMDGASAIPLSAQHRQAAGVAGGDLVEITLALDTEPRTVTVPEDLAEALQTAGLRAEFDAASYSVRKEYVRQVERAKAAETRVRRIGVIVERLRG